MSDLFPHRARIGSTAYGLDADTFDHRSESAPQPDLVVTEKPDPLVLWHADGERYRLVGDQSVAFGFHGKAER